MMNTTIFKKQILGTFILLFVTGLFFTSCSKNDNAKPAESPFTGMYGGGLVYKNETLYQGHFSITVAKDGSFTGSYSVYLTTPDTKGEVKGNVLKDGRIIMEKDDFGLHATISSDKKISGTWSLKTEHGVLNPIPDFDGGF